MDKKAKIIFFNGVSSAGKTAIAKELQSILEDAYLHVSLDQFFDMLPEKYINSSQGISFETQQVNDKPVTKVIISAEAKKIFSGMRHAIAALANQGNNLIIDEVLIGNELNEYTQLLAPFKVYYVGIFAPLSILETRELKRLDRIVGLARWQYDIVHQSKDYDLKIDTANLSPMQCAELIKNKFHL